MGHFAKAVIAAVVAGLGVIVEGLTDGSLNAQEYINAVIAMLALFGSVYLTPNSSKNKKQPTA